LATWAEWQDLSAEAQGVPPAENVGASR